MTSEIADFTWFFALQYCYTRIIKVGRRPGDAAPMAVLELVSEPVAKATKGTTEESQKAKPSRKAAPKKAKKETKKEEAAA